MLGMIEIKGDPDRNNQNWLIDRSMRLEAIDKLFYAMNNDNNSHEEIWVLLGRFQGYFDLNKKGTFDWISVNFNDISSIITATFEVKRVEQEIIDQRKRTGEI